MSAFTESKERIRAWSWPMKLAMLAGVLLVLYLAWDTYVRPRAERWDSLATAIEKEVDEVYRGSTLASTLRGNMRQPVTTLGPVMLPPPEAEGAMHLNNALNDILARHGVPGANRSVRSRAKLPKSALVGVTGGAKRIDRLMADVKFDARPEAAIAIIADLESAPEIQAVTTVRMTRDTGGRVQVHLIVESWVISAELDTGATA